MVTRDAAAWAHDYIAARACVVLLRLVRPHAGVAMQATCAIYPDDCANRLILAIAWRRMRRDMHRRNRWTRRA